MSLFRCQNKSAVLLMSARFLNIVVFRDQSLVRVITPEHKNLTPVLLYIRNLVPRSAIGSLLNTRNGLWAGRGAEHTVRL